MQHLRLRLREIAVVLLALSAVGAVAYCAGRLGGKFLVRTISEPVACYETVIRPYPARTAAATNTPAAPAHTKPALAVRTPEAEAKTRELTGVASWYDYTFNPDGTTRECRTRAEDCYSEHWMIAAMRDVPRRTWVTVTRLDTGESVKVKITDYGPEFAVHPDRVIDLSSLAFSKLGSLSEGTFRVKVTW